MRFLYMMIVSCLPIVKKYEKIVSRSPVARVTLMLSSSMMPNCMQKNYLGKLNFIFADHFADSCYWSANLLSYQKKINSLPKTHHYDIEICIE